MPLTTEHRLLSAAIGSAGTRPKRFSCVWGVDFSGARAAGRNTWVAKIVRSPGSGARWRLETLKSLEEMAGTRERGPALAHLVSTIRMSSGLWGIDAPFGLPVEILDDGDSWLSLLRFTSLWPEDARAFGLWCVGRCRERLGRMHVRRVTDVDTKTPFDCYHYRIIHQTYHAMRDVLVPLTKSSAIAVMPFQPRRLTNAKAVVVEACPSSTLKRWQAPHRNYKQAGVGPVTRERRRVRRVIFEHIEARVAIPERVRALAMSNPGGDAIDAILAAVGVAEAWESTSPDRLSPRARREGYVYA